MKKTISIAAAAVIMLTSIGYLTVDVSAANNSSSVTANAGNAPVFKDVNGNAVSDKVLNTAYSRLTKEQKYIYKQYVALAKNNGTSATLNKKYSFEDTQVAGYAFLSDYAYMSWIDTIAAGHCLPLKTPHENFTVESIDSRGWIKLSNGSYLLPGGSALYAQLYEEYTGKPYEPDVPSTITIVYYTDLNKNCAYTLAMMDAYTKPMLEKAAKLGTDIEKIKYVHDWLIYNTMFMHDEKIMPDYSQSAYSALVCKKSVCAGYSRSFVYCMQKLGIQAMMVSGTTHGGSHEWNLVKADGEWYEVDVLWDDSQTSAEKDFAYNYFMQTTASLKANDTSRIKYWADYVPTAKGTKYSPDNYSYRNGSDFSGLAKVVVPNKKDFEAAQQTQTTATSKPVVTVTADGNTAKISWTAVSGATKYRVYKYENGKLVKLGATTSLSYKVKGLSKGTYKYAVKAYVDGKWTTVKTSDMVSVTIK